MQYNSLDNERFVPYLAESLLVTSVTVPCHTVSDATDGFRVEYTTAMSPIVV